MSERLVAIMSEQVVGIISECLVGIIGIRTSWLDGMGVSSAEDTKTGPKPGLRKQTTPCCEALDQLIALGLYHPKPRGAAAAARLIKQIVGSSLTEKGIAAAISEYHEDLVYRPNRLKRKSF